jgi:hypothetical protein
MAKSGHLKLVEKTDVPAEDIVDSYPALFARAMARDPVNMCIGVLSSDGFVYVESDLESDFAEAGFISKMHQTSSAPDDDSA